MLGKTIPEIARQKGGIYKVSLYCTYLRYADRYAHRVEYQRLRSISRRKGWTFYGLAPPNWERRHSPSCRSSQSSTRYHWVRLTLPMMLWILIRFAGLAGAHQKTNASLAVALVQAFLASPSLPAVFSAAALPSPTDSSKSLPSALLSPSPLSPAMIEGLKNTRWPGRCQIAADTESNSLKWFLDGAHTVESIACCADWFRTAALDSSSWVHPSELLCEVNSNGLVSAGNRNNECSSSTALLAGRGTRCSVRFSRDWRRRRWIRSSTSSFAPTRLTAEEFQKEVRHSPSVSHRVVLTRHIVDLTSKAVDAADLEQMTLQRELATAWKEVSSSLATVHVLGSIQEAVELARGVEGEVEVLVTGSLHLVGGVMAFADLPLEN